MCNQLLIFNNKGEAVVLMMPFGLKIAIINRAFRRKLDEKAAALGLTAVQLRVLGSISRLEAAGETEIHQKDLEQIEHVTHPAMTKLLQRLESKELIRCVPSDRDRRYKKITCTQQSAQVYKMILEQDQEVFLDLCRTLTPQEKEELVRLADRILANIDSK